MDDRSLIIFTPKIGIEASANLLEFIKMCRYKLTVFGSNLRWEENHWIISEIKKRGITHRLGFSFANFHTAGSKKDIVPMEQPYLDFAKAFMRYSFGLNKSENHNLKLAAVRSLEYALIQASPDGVPRVEKATAAIFNLASQALLAKNPGSAFGSGCHLQRIAEFLCDNFMVGIRFSWKNPVSRPQDIGSRVGEEFDRKRKEKLPSKAAIRALPLIYHTATDPIDVIISSMGAILLSAPDRFSEICVLPENCDRDGTDEDGKAVYGLVWDASKGGGAGVNWIPTSMADICREAVNKIRKQTEESRRIAKWYEDNPNKLYLPKDLEYLRRQNYVVSSDLALLLGISRSCLVCRWANARKIESIKVRPKGGIGADANAYSFKGIESEIVKMLPPGFPFLDEKRKLKYSDALLVIPYNLLHPGKGTYRCLFQTISIHSFNDQLGARVEHGASSVFSRNGYTEPDGSHIHITSHKFRHFLVTLALRKRVGYVIATLWRKSKNTEHTRSYDHVSNEEMLERLRDAAPHQMVGPIAEVAVNAPVSREEFMEMMYPCVHSTQFGFCVHDWQMLPCQKMTNCLACTEHICIKGDKQKTARVRRELKDAELQLERDEAGIANGQLGTDRWVRINRKRVERLRQLVGIFDDPTVLEGTIIQLSIENEFSLIGHAVNNRRQLGDEDAAMLDGIRRRSLEDKVPLLSLTAKLTA